MACHRRFAIDGPHPILAAYGMAQLTIQQAFDLASKHHQSGRLQQAQQLYQQILARQPDHAGAMHHLGVLAHQQEQNDLAAELIRKAIALNPNVPQAHNSLGTALQAIGQTDEAIASYTHALALKPKFPSALFNLGAAQQSKGQLDESIAAYRAAIATQPDYVQAHSNLGIALKEKGELDQAITAFRSAIAVDPNYADAHYNLGLALRAQGNLTDAIDSFRQAIALQPNSPLAHLNLGMSLLARQDFQQGWEEYEWRWKCRPSPQRTFDQPKWDGSSLNNRTLLIHAEQGFGDTIQFIRYLPLVAQRMDARGGRIVIECQPELEQLLATIAQKIPQAISGRWHIISRCQPLPPFDLHCPLLSLPWAFKTTLDSIPAEVPYLFPDPNRIQRFRQGLIPSGSNLKIGLAWAGSPTHKHDRTRSVSLDQLAPLAAVPGAKFYSLQKGPAAAQAKSPPPGLNLIDWTDEFSNFNDAALIANLDLIITVDTSIAHLAGALGRPTWVLLSFAPDWRWLLDREDSPWYPSMRLFRQPSLGDWESVVGRVAEALTGVRS